MAFRIRGTKSKTRKAYRLSKHTKYFDTSIERQTKTILESLGAIFTPQGDRQHPILTKSYNHPFYPDFIINEIPGKRFEPLPCLLEVQGPYHFKSLRQINKTSWRQTCLTFEGYPLILLHHEWLKLVDITNRLRVSLLNIREGECIRLEG